MSEEKLCFEPLSLEAAAEKLERAKSVLILFHINPDGDGWALRLLCDVRSQNSESELGAFAHPRCLRGFGLQ